MQWIILCQHISAISVCRSNHFKYWASWVWHALLFFLVRLKRAAHTILECGKRPELIAGHIWGGWIHYAGVITPPGWGGKTAAVTYLSVSSTPPPLVPQPSWRSRRGWWGPACRRAPASRRKPATAAWTAPVWTTPTPWGRAWRGAPWAARCETSPKQVQPRLLTS